MSYNGRRVLGAAPWTALAVSAALALLALPISLNRPGGFQSRVIGDVVFGFSFLAFSLVGAVIASRRPNSAIGWIFCASGLLNVVALAATEYGVQVIGGTLRGLPGGIQAMWLGSWLVVPATTAIVFIVLLFPDGHLASARWRPVLVGAVMLMFAPGLAAISPGPLADSTGSAIFSQQNPFGVEAVRPITSVIGSAFFPLFALLLALAGVSMVLRARRSTGDERQQIRWFAFAAVVVGLAAISGVVINTIPASPAAQQWNGVIGAVGLLALGIGTGIGVLKYRLYDIDVVVNRALVYGIMAVIIAGLYVGIAVAIGSIVSTRTGVVLAVITTALVGLAFQPARARLQRLANRVVYGKRATPYEVLSDFSARIAETVASEEVVPRMARVLAEGTGASRASVYLRVGDSLHVAASWPSGAADSAPIPIANGEMPTLQDVDRATPVRLQGELLGALAVTKRAGDTITPVEQRLQDDLAHQAGPVLRNVALTEQLMGTVNELRASRQRLVAAQDEERRRLERNLHDGAQQHLVALKVKIGLVRAVAKADPEKADDILAGLGNDADEALETLRDLARGIFPPLLADKGLTAALDAQARKATLPVDVTADGVERYAPAVEAAVYFCALEALQNVQKYAAATRATIQLRQEGATLHFEVRDDGAGFDPAAHPRGSGLTNMEDRLDALGGSIAVESGVGRGTVVMGWIPVNATAGAPGSDASPGDGANQP